MIILPCLEFLFAGSYVTTLFLLMFVFGLLFSFTKGVMRWI